MSGVELIAAERQRQRERFTGDHDHNHVNGELVEAALCYGAVACAEARGSCAEEWPVGMFDGHADSILSWPWDDDDWKPSDDPIRNLVKAGALIAAEIDRLKSRC